MQIVAKSNKEVRDNIQRAVATVEGYITLINKNGRKIVLTRSFKMSKWRELDELPWGAAFQKREFIKSLKTTVIDNTPESHCLRDRIIDSQISAINEVYSELSSRC